MDRETLVILPALPAKAGDNGSFVLTRKFLDGVMEYVRDWPGPVTVAMERVTKADSNLDHVQVMPEDVPFELRWIDWRNGVGAARELLADARVALVSLVDKHTRISQLAATLSRPVVYISEYSVTTRRQIIRAETRNPILRWRRERWTLALERRYEQAVRLAAGVQCNGTPTYHAYRALNPSTLLYFDTRVRASQLASVDTLEARTKELLEGGPLRLAFSGRLIAMKGVDHLPRVAAELKRLNVPFSMDICGGGVLERRLRKDIRRLELDSEVRLRGVLDFQRELMPFVARHVDLFVCCHRQGDPACTYLETMSCGTPIVGYDNEAFHGLVSASGVGWLTPMDKPEQLAARIAELNRSRQELADAATASLAFASRHTFEKTMRMRVDHMIACAEASEGVASGAASAAEVRASC